MKWIDIRESGESYNDAIHTTYWITKHYKLHTLLTNEIQSILWCVMNPKHNKWRNTF